MPQVFCSHLPPTNSHFPTELSSIFFSSLQPLHSSTVIMTQLIVSFFPLLLVTLLVLIFFVFVFVFVFFSSQESCIIDPFFPSSLSSLSLLLIYYLPFVFFSIQESGMTFSFFSPLLLVIILTFIIFFAICFLL